MKKTMNKTFIRLFFLSLLICNLYCSENGNVNNRDKEMFSNLEKVVEKYFNSNIHPNLDSLLDALHPQSRLYPNEVALKKLRSTESSSSVVEGFTDATIIKILREDGENITVEGKIYTEIVAHQTGNSTKGTAEIKIDFKRHEDKWKIFDAQIIK